MRPAVTVLGTVRRAERTLLGHIRCELDTGDTRYDVLADPHPLLEGGQRIRAVLRPLLVSPDIPQWWHLIWCRPERPPTGDAPESGAIEGLPPKE